MNLTVDDLKLDKLQLFFGAGYQINNFLAIKQPTIGDIVELGEENYSLALNGMIQTVWEAKALLWDMGFDWEKISDFEFFCMRVKGLEPSITKVFFDIDFTKFDLAENENGELVLVQTLPNNHVLRIDQYIYSKITLFLREINNIPYPTVRHPSNENIKKLQIQMDKREQKRKHSDADSFLLTAISALLVSPEFKYDKESIKKVSLFEFYYSLERIQINRQSTALMSGMYANADFSKMKDFSTTINWLRTTKKQEESKLKLENPN